ncbi:MAG: hypothetical protein ISP45_05340 [Reyranella sp.]|nr:hypothetical protein [Reyranella sp.]
MRVFRPVWVALRTAVVATAVFWVIVFIIENSGWQLPSGVAEPLVFLVVFFFGFWLVPKH